MFTCNNFTVTPVSSSSTRIEYSVSGNVSGYTCKFSITQLPTGVLSLVDFGDFRQKDKHYTTFERAFNGMLCICRRRFAKEV